MKSALLFTLLSGTTLLQAQEPATTPAPPASDKPKLTEAQVTGVLNQLKDLESSILSQRGQTLGEVMKALTAACESDQAAMKFYTSCDVKVNSERKEASKTEARQRAEQIERAMERKGRPGAGADDEEGDSGLALRLGLKYLMLTLKAHETKDEDFAAMIQPLQSYIGELVTAAPNLKGRAFGTLTRVCGGNSPVVQAYQLDRYLTRKHWSRSPTEIGAMYQETLFHIAESESPDKLPELWNNRISAESNFRKSQMAEPEYLIWLQNELPPLRWSRATYLYQKGPSAIDALKDMLTVIRESPSHADAPSWVEKMRQHVNESAPTASTSGEAGTN